MDPQTLELVTPAAHALITTTVNSLLKPLVQGAVNALGAGRDEIVNLFVNRFDGYLVSSYARYAYLPTLVFPNDSKLLEDLYVPLTLRRFSNPGAHENPEDYLIDRYPTELFNKHKDTLVVDTAGMGKSTILKYIFLMAIKEEAKIPILLELRKIPRDMKFFDYILNEIQGISSEIKSTVFVDVINRGNFVFLLDGADEIPPERRANVISNLQDFKSQANRNSFILTSRDEPSLATFADFQRFQIMPLAEKSAFEVIRKYAISKEIADSLINRLTDPAYSSVKEFLVNPLLVSLLYKSYEFKKTIPLKLHIFYRQVYDALFENHDLSKDGGYVRQKLSGLDVEQFHSVLRAFGFKTYKDSRIELDGDNLIQNIEWAKSRNIGLEFLSSAFKKDITSSVPLLVADGLYHRWAHRSIQEYFAAGFVCRDMGGKDIDFLRNILDENKIAQHTNLLILCADLNYSSFARGVLYGLLKKYISSLDAAIGRLSNLIPREEIIRRHEVAPLSDFVIVNTSDLDFSGGSEIVGGNSALNVIIQRVNQVFGDAAQNRSWQIAHTKPSALALVRPNADPLLQRLAQRSDMTFVKASQAKKTEDIPMGFLCTAVDHGRFLRDDPNDALNDPTIYPEITTYIKLHSNYQFDTVAVRKLLLEIERDEAFTAREDFFL